MSNARRIGVAVLVGVATITWARGVGAQQNSYRVVEGHVKLPEGRKMGSTAAIALDRDGASVWVFERCGANDCVASPQVPPVLKFDASGQLVKNFGAGMFVRPHGIHIDRHDVLWVTDYQSDEKINPGFRRGITFGSAKDGKVTGFIPDPDATPSQEGIAVDTQGNVYSSLTGGRAIRKYARP
jgi:hypothetical protein